MQGFRSELVYRDVDGMIWEIMKPFTYVTLSGKHITVQPEFFTDFCSTPKLKLLLTLMPQRDLYDPATVLHDWAWRKQQWDDGTPITKKEANDLLREVCLYLKFLGRNIPTWRVDTMYWVLDKFGVMPCKIVRN